jgi:hypothetical protein
MRGIHSLTFDLTDCTMHEQSDRRRGWVNSEGVAHLLRYNPGPPDWPFDLRDPAAAQFFYHRQCEENRGVMLGCEVVRAAGAEALWGLFKYRSPQTDSLAMYFVGILWMPFQECTFQLNVEAIESGTTGLREATVMALTGFQFPQDEQKEIPTINSEEELQELYRKALPRHLPSDDPKYDDMFPQHPLSLVRARLAKVIETARFAQDAGRLRPYRIVDGK